MQPVSPLRTLPLFLASMHNPRRVIALGLCMSLMLLLLSTVHTMTLLHDLGDRLIHLDPLVNVFHALSHIPILLPATLCTLENRTAPNQLSSSTPTLVQFQPELQTRKVIVAFSALFSLRFYHREIKKKKILPGNKKPLFSPPDLIER